MDQRQVIELLTMTATTVVGLITVSYLLKSLLNTNKESKNNHVQTGSTIHKRINQLLFDNEAKKLQKQIAQIAPTTPHREFELALSKKLDALRNKDLFNTCLSPHERVIAQCLVFSEDIDAGFDDIGGMNDIKKSIRESLCYPFQYAHLYQQQKKNSKSLTQEPKGVLLYGPPGTGKTLLAKAIAKECSCVFLNVQTEMLGDFLLGESEKLAAAIFSLAKKVEPCIVFIDEIDALFTRRNGPHMHDSRKNQISVMLSQWDGFYSNHSNDDEHSPKVIVIGASNDISQIDPAAYRRLPLRYHVPLPDTESRRQILDTYLRHEFCDESVDLYKLANLTQGMSGSDIKEMIKKALSYPMSELIWETRENRDQTTDMLAENNIDEVLPLSVRPLSYNDLVQAHQYLQTNEFTPPPLHAFHY